LEKTLTIDALHGKTDYTPFEGFLVKGWPILTICRGNIIVQDGNMVAKPGTGECLKRDKFKPF